MTAEQFAVVLSSILRDGPHKLYIGGKNLDFQRIDGHVDLIDTADKILRHLEDAGLLATTLETRELEENYVLAAISTEGDITTISRPRVRQTRHVTAWRTTTGNQP